MKRRSITRPEVRVGGRWLSGIAPNWGGLKTGTRTNGDWQASWTVVLKPHQRPPALRYGASVEVHLGPEVLFVGSLTEPNWDSGEMVAIGACRESESTPALTAAGVATTKPNTAVDAAISRGVVSWTRVGNFGTTAVGDDDDQGGLYTVQSLLDAWAEENLSGWRVDRNRALVIDTPTEDDPAWFVVPGSGVLGSADEERVDRIFVRYMSTSAGKLATASYPAASVVGGVERPMDITDRGRMSSTRAAAIAEAEWEKLRGRSGWTNGLALTAGQVTTPGGVRADLALIRAGQSIRLLGVPDVRGLASNTDVIIGDTEYDWDEDTIQINPVGLASRDAESALEEVGQLAASAKKKAEVVASTAARVGMVWAGSSTVELTAASTGTVVVSFPTDRFRTAPTVVATTTSQSYYANLVSTSTTNVEVRVNHRDGTAATASVGIRVIAVEQ